MRIIFFTLFILNSFCSFAQEDGYIIQYDNYVPNSTIKLNSALVLVGYTSYYFVIPTNSHQKNENLQKFIKPPNVSVIKKMNENEIITREINPENGTDLYYVREELKGLMNWKIQKEKKNILGHICQKATVNFRGRSYVAYFSSKLAYSDGPYKFFNLPGLIFEIYSIDGFVKFSINSMKKVHLNIDHSSFDQLKSQYITYELFKKQLKVIMEEKSKKYNAKGIVDENGFKSSVSFDIERIEKE